MRKNWIPLLRCPVLGVPLDLDPTRMIHDEVAEGFLVARESREVRLVVAGVGVLVRDLPAHLRSYGNVYTRMPLHDSRVTRFVLGRAGRGGFDRVPFEEVVSRYGDLVPAGTHAEPSAMAPRDAALSRLLAGSGSGSGGRALDIGCGVGRGVFVLLGSVDEALGIDRSIARVRRARNVAATQADFFLPAPPDTGLREIPIELDRLDRDGADFAAANACAVPLASDCMSIVVLRRGDGLGPWDDHAVALAEAARVLAPDGLLVTEGPDAPSDAAWRAVGSETPFTAWRRT